MNNFSDTDIQNFNLLGEFCGPRDIENLDSKSLQSKFKIAQADVFVLFGGSIIQGVDVLAQAIQNKVAKRYLIVGGFGHTTATLKETAQKLYPKLPNTATSEAELFADILKRRFNLEADLLETKSTNCGNNITYLLNLLKLHQIEFKSIILAQDATMQRRMSACLKKYVSADTDIINYATYQAELQLSEGTLKFKENHLGMWNPERYQQLLMGEIARLTDNEFGYGPKGKDFIVHVDIPQIVTAAYLDLKQKYPQISRPGNVLYASKNN